MRTNISEKSEECLPAEVGRVTVLALPHPPSAGELFGHFHGNGHIRAAGVGATMREIHRHSSAHTKAKSVTKHWCVDMIARK